MDNLKKSTDWTKAELLSNGVFILFGVTFVAASLGFWHMGKTEMANAFAIPTLVAGALLLILGGGLLYGTWKSLAGFDTAYTRDASAFVASEIARETDMPPLRNTGRTDKRRGRSQGSSW